MRLGGYIESGMWMQVYEESREGVLEFGKEVSLEEEVVNGMFSCRGRCVWFGCHSHSLSIFSFCSGLVLLL